MREVMAPPLRKHFYFLDGLRGLAALYVVAHHALLQVTLTYPPTAISPTFLAMTKWLLFGQVSVDVFIVLSGFCLMLPAARGDGSLRGGLSGFVRRRARRILPPYYAVLVLSLLIIWLVPGLSHRANGLWSQSLPAFSFPVLTSHLFLVHNFSDAWLHKVNYPLWSVATEWQIYFAFAFVLLPICQRFGVVAAIGAAFGVAYLPRLVFHHRLDGACLHFTVLFAFGMAAAVLAFPRKAIHQKMADNPVWGWVGGAALLTFGFLAGFRTLWLLKHYSVQDMAVGVATAALLLIVTRQSQGLRPLTKGSTWVHGILEHPAAVKIGTFSYSLYLLHAPVLALVFYALSFVPMSAPTSFLLVETVGIPACLVSAYLFHLAFERPFMSAPAPKSEKQAEEAALVSPAP